MNQHKHPNYFLLFCLTGSLIVVFFVVKPFLTALVLAAVFAFLFQPIYTKFLKFTKGRKSLSAFATTILAIVLVILPILFLSTLILKESAGLYQTLATGEKGNVVSMAETVLNQVRQIIPIQADFQLNVGQYLQQGLEKLIQHLGGIFSSFAKMLLNTFVFLTALYFLLKDGIKLKEYVVTLSPLDDKDDNFIVTRLESAVSATVKGNLTIGLIQGILTGIGFALFGVPNAVLWGSVAAIMALVPGIGTALVILPAVIYLIFTENTFVGIGLLTWGLVAVGLIDNFLGPKLIGRGMQLHPLVVFISVLGGLAFFGPLGFLLGPLFMSICMALLDIHSSLKREGEKNI